MSVDTVKQCHGVTETFVIEKMQKWFRNAANHSEDADELIRKASPVKYV